MIRPFTASRGNDTPREFRRGATTGASGLNSVTWHAEWNAAPEHRSSRTQSRGAIRVSLVPTYITLWPKAESDQGSAQYTWALDRHAAGSGLDWRGEVNCAAALQDLACACSGLVKKPSRAARGQGIRSGGTGVDAVSMRIARRFLAARPAPRGPHVQIRSRRTCPSTAQRGNRLVQQVYSQALSRNPCLRGHWPIRAMHAARASNQARRILTRGTCRTIAVRRLVSAAAVEPGRTHRFGGSPVIRRSGD
jgi:hypothetical protein